MALKPPWLSALEPQRTKSTGLCWGRLGPWNAVSPRMSPAGSWSQARNKADVRGPCTPRNFRSHTSTGPRPVVLKLGSGVTARLESPKGICLSLKNKKTGGRQERQYGASRREEQAASGSFSWPPGAAQVGPPPRPSYIEGGGTGPPTLPHSFPVLLAWRRGREKEEVPQVTQTS